MAEAVGAAVEDMDEGGVAAEVPEDAVAVGAVGAVEATVGVGAIRGIKISCASNNVIFCAATK